MAALDHIHFDCIDSTNTYARQNASRLADGRARQTG